MKRQPATIEQFLWLIILVLAFGLRLINLGSEPLSDGEARWALQALSVFQGAQSDQSLLPGPQAGYITLTGLLFWVLGSSDAAARLLPAVAGGLLCLAPFFFRDWIGRRAALIMGLGLALDPGLLAVSRLAGGPMPALSFLLVGLGLLAAGRVVLSGIIIGLGVLSGAAFWQGVLILGLSAGLASLAGKVGWLPASSDQPDFPEQLFPPLSEWKTGWVSAGLTVLLAGTLFSRFPQGLGATVASIPEYLAGWATYQGVSVAQMLVVLLSYQPLAVIFGFIGAVRGWVGSSTASRWLSIWSLVALLVVVLYPGRQIVDLVWLLVPMWGLASIELARYLDVKASQRVIVFGQSALVFVLLSLLWLNLAGFSLSAIDQRAYWLRVGILLGVLFLVGLTTVLLGYGFDWKVAWQGLVWGLVAGFFIYQVAGMWSASRLQTAQVLNIWHPSPQPAENHLFMQAVDELSKRNTGMANQIDVLVAVDSPSMRWSFRDFPNARFVPEQSAAGLGGSPSLVITRLEEQNPELAAAYRGQDLAWWRLPGWSGALPQSLPAWIAYRKNPASLASVILWARTDLFVDVSAEGEAAFPAEELNAPVQQDLPQQ